MSALDLLCNYLILARDATAEQGIELTVDDRLNTATRILEMASERPTAANRYGRWTADEDNRVIEGYRPGSTHQDYARIGAAIGRSVSAVKDRARKLGLTQGKLLEDAVRMVNGGRLRNVKHNV